MAADAEAGEQAHVLHKIHLAILVGVQGTGELLVVTLPERRLCGVGRGGMRRQAEEGRAAWCSHPSPLPSTPPPRHQQPTPLSLSLPVPLPCLVQFRVAIVDVLVQGPQTLGLSYKNPGQGNGWSAKLGCVGSSWLGQKGRLRKCHSRSGPKVTEGADTVLATTGSTGVPRLLRVLAFLCCLADGEGSF